MNGQDVLREVASLATNLGPALAPVGYDELLSSILTAARRLFRAGACSLALLDEDELVFHLASGGAEEIVGRRLPVGEGVAGWVVATGQSIAIQDVSQDERFARDVADSVGYVPSSILAMPLETERKMLGVIEILDWEEDTGDRRADMELLELFARQVALAIENSRVFNDLGRALFAAVALVSDQDDLGAALRQVADESAPPTSDLAALAADFRELARLGPQERRVAARLVAEFLAYVRPRRR